MTRYTCTRRCIPDYDEPYNPLPRPKGGSTISSSTQNGVQGWWVGGEWIEQPPPNQPSKHQQRSRSSPLAMNNARDSDCYDMRPPVPQKVKAGRATQSVHFDFNNGEQPVPWTTKADNGLCYKVRLFADTADEELLSYLANRSISGSFLVEIDQFLCSHPEIADCLEGRETIMQLNSLSPLQAYKFFLRGYTRPARYIDGIVRSEHFTLPVDYPYRPLRNKIDPELVDFFEGFEYRWDIIDRIDHTVRGGIYELSRGRLLPSGYRRLICYAVWGNASDAYKWYEYHLQEDYLPHRYLPEHVVLGHLPKIAGEADPQPSSLNTFRRHRYVRYRMARANDEGIDVLEVLMTEFKAALIRKGFRRIHIDSMYNRAKYRLENERKHPTGIDIVDLIMDELPAERSAHPSRINNRVYTFPFPDRSRSCTVPLRSSRRRRNNKPRMQNIPPALKTQAAELRLAKTSLERTYNQERNVNGLSLRCKGVTFNVPEITAACARAERRYTNCLVRYLRDTNQMTPNQAKEMQANFTRRKMEESGVSNEAYLLGMYPMELK